MNTLTTTPNTTRAVGAGVFTFDLRNTFPTAEVNIRPSKIVYYIEDAILSGELIDVDYTLNDKWLNITLEFQALKNFVTDSGLNEYCFDSSDYTGQHVQHSGSFDLDTYLSENLEYAVKAYLEAGKVGQYHVN